MNNDLTTAAGLSAAPQLLDKPKSVRISTVENGFTVTLEGGKQKEGEPYKHNKLHVAKSTEEAIQLASEFLAD